MGETTPFAVARMAHEGADCSQSPRVSHSYTALAFYTGGHSRVELNGQHLVREGDLLLVPAGAPHCTLEAGRLEFWGLRFQAAPLSSSTSSTLSEPFERVRRGASAVVHVPSERHAYLNGLFSELEGLNSDRRGADTAVRDSLFTLILSEVDRSAALMQATSKLHDSVVGSALRFIERNCLRKLTLGDVADAVGRSPAYVTTALTRATGRSAVQWMISGRMAEARRLLLHSDERVDIIAERVGYADVTHFIRLFRRESGVTPAAWRTAQLRSQEPHPALRQITSKKGIEFP